MKTKKHFTWSKYSKIRMIIITAILVVIITLSIIWFGVSYNRLNDSIENERIESMGQIGDVIMEKIQLISDSYENELKQVSKLLMASNIHSFQDINNIFGTGSDICLLTEEGRCYDLEGKTISFTSLELLSIIDNISIDEVNSNFYSIRTKGDYWIFSIGIESMNVAGHSVIGVLKLVDDTEYESISTNMIFGASGSTYVVNNGGEVVFRPDNLSSGDFFRGHNIISYLEEIGVDEYQLEVFQNTLLSDDQQNKAQIIVDVNNVRWIIQVIPSSINQNIVLTVPISVTGKETFSSMRSTIVAIIIMVTSIAVLSVAWFYSFGHRNNIMRLEHAKANSKSDFMSKMSHDIRTPLNAIVGMIEIAKRIDDNKEAVDKCLDSMKSSSEYLVSIINDVLDVNKIENGKMTINKIPFNLKELLENIKKMELIPAQLKKIDLGFESNIQDDKLYIGDSVRINQCLINLISNAIKFTPEGGKITVQCFETVLEDYKRNVKFIVTDNGVGMSKEFISKIFQPFEQEYVDSSTNTTTGSGLGLSIVYHLTALMGGQITVDSKKDVGSCFTIDLPLEITEQKIEEKKKNFALNAEALKGKRVLLAEDNEINRQIVTYFLKELGMVIEEAVNGQIVVDKFTSSSPNYYDVILMDIQMPLMNGYEATKEIRKSDHPNAKEIVIIALSANAYSEDALKSYEVGMQAHLPKPLDPIILKETLIEYICQDETKKEKI